MTKQARVIIKHLEKTELKFCNSRQMDVTVIDKDKLITVSMSATPSSNLRDNKNFDWFWTTATEGMECVFIKNDNQNYLMPPT